MFGRDRLIVLEKKPLDTADEERHLTGFAVGDDEVEAEEAGEGDDGGGPVHHEHDADAEDRAQQTDPGVVILKQQERQSTNQVH